MIKINLSKQDTPAAQLMVIEVISELLVSTSPNKLSEVLTDHLRELSGARTVMVMAHRPEPLPDELLHVSPSRRMALFSTGELNSFCLEKYPDVLPFSPKDLPLDYPARAALLNAGVKSIARYPLHASGELVGLLLLFDLPGIDRIAETNQIIHLLAPTIALALKNALAFRKIEQQAEELDQLVLERTAELADLCAELQVKTALLEVEAFERKSAQESLEEQTVNLEAEVAERRQVEIALLSSERRFREFLENIRMIAVTLDTNGMVTFCNDYLVTTCGWQHQEIIGTNWFDRFIPAGILTEVSEVFAKGMSTGAITPHYENAIMTRGGELRTIVWDNSILHDPGNAVIGVASIGIDVTDHRNLEEQLRQSQKMEAIGQLAGGMAHDFNNILSVIMGYGAMLKMGNSLDQSQRERLDLIIGAAERAAQLTSGLLAFSRKQVLTPKIVNLNEIVRQLHKFLVRVIGEDIHLETIHYDADLPVNVDSGQMEQALINLATNARDAMPQGGLLTIKTGPQMIDASFTHAHGYGQSGQYAVITVSDTGCGMSEEARKKIFEPFFTTKEPGKGTGLGMAIVYGIIKQHNGFINVYSEPGKGTAFRIYLPLASKDSLPSEIQTVPSAPEMGSETILVAEDDPVVRHLVATILAEYGYKVILAEDGLDAVKQFTLNRDRVKLVLMDMIMPKQSGTAAATGIRELDPDARVLFSSGYTADFIKKRGLEEDSVELIMKPYQPLELLRKVREMLDR